MSPYISLQSKPQDVVLEVGLSFMVWTEARGKILTDSRLPSPSLRQAHRQALERQGRSTDVDYYTWALRFAALWGVSEPTKWLHRFENDRSIRGASQQQQPHKSNSSGRVKPLTPLLARKKTHVPPEVRLPFLVHTGCETREENVTQSYATKAVLWSSPQDFAFQQKPCSFAS